MRILGIDGGISSIGWAVVDLESHRIVAAGTRMFDSPEEATKSGPKLKNADRRLFRGQRRTIRRRAKRMADIRKLFHASGLLPSGDRGALAAEAGDKDPWSLRAEGLDRKLTSREWALALGHIARHRGFRSNRKGAESNKASENQKVLASIEATREKSQRWRTVGEMFARDDTFIDRKRNRDGDYTRSILRADQEAEVRKLFAAQRRHGNPHTSDELEATFSELAFSQKPLQGSLGMVSDCPFLPDHKRASVFAPSFERFRLLSRLTNLRLVTADGRRALTPDEITKALSGYARTKSLTFKALRTKLGLVETDRFDGVGPDIEKRDIARRTGAALEGTKTLLDVLIPAIGEIEAFGLLERGTPLDEATAAIAFNEDLGDIETGLQASGLPAEAVSALLEAARQGAFDTFKGTAALSAAAARALCEPMGRGLVYSDACAELGWSHSEQSVMDLSAIGSPVAQKAAREILKQIKAVSQAFGPFDRVHVEMARDVGKSSEERRKIENGINKRTDERHRAAEELADHLGKTASTLRSEDILRYELWKEQNGRCLYSGKAIPLQAVLATDNAVQIDHILPWSRFGDDSFVNKTLCFTKANADKKNRTPYEWKSAEQSDDWERFQAEVESNKALKGLKKRNYLIRNASDREEAFRSRNLNDTRFALKVVLAHLKDAFPNLARETGGERRVFARPGALTAALRRAWDLESLKKGAHGERLEDDRHHALDAIVTALCSESLLQRATALAKAAEIKGEKFELRGLPAPWGTPAEFRNEVAAVVQAVFVSRPESGRIRGKGHDATIRQIREIDGEAKVFERKAIEELKIGDLDRIPVPKPYGKIVDPGKLRDQLLDSLKSWIEAGKPKDALPLSPKGDPVRKIRLMTSNKPGISVRGGTAGREAIVRLDVFCQMTTSGIIQYRFIPIYRFDFKIRKCVPDRYFKRSENFASWPKLSEDMQFKFSVYRNTLMKIIDSEGKAHIGYYKSFDTRDGRISLMPPSGGDNYRIPTTTALKLEKYFVDRIGSQFLVSKEKRTWRGKACI
ncbi:MAG: type II CRISPR RNA-guided endonuclease Cas9 [Polymorphum sp.]|nr:type II CRISPR RNA-guided endonuclease Cas9 [Polymorphum sp.]